MIILDFILGVAAIHQILFWTYTWQLKEYRVDRLVDGLSNNWDWMIKQYNLRIWYRPKLTPRSILIFLIGMGLMILISYYWLVLAPLGMAIAVGLSTPLFNFQKKRIIKKATKKMKDFKGIVVGITGSYGKSSTKELLAAVLSKKFKIAMTSKNVNSEIGVAQTVLDWSDEIEIGIVEMGAYKIGEIKAICGIVHPQIGIITGIGDQHLSLFGSLKNIKKAKYELIESLPKNGKAFIAGKNFTENKAQKIEIKKDSIEFEYKKVRFEIPILGRQQIRNIIGVIKTAEYLGMNIKEIAGALKEVNKNNFWPKLIEVNNNLTVIDNSYNASKESFLALIDYLQVWKDYKKIIVTPGLIELGSNSLKDHQIIGEKLKAIDKVILTNGKFAEPMNRWGNVKVIFGVKNIIKEMKSEVKDKTVVAFKSRVARPVIEAITNNEF